MEVSAKAKPTVFSRDTILRRFTVLAFGNCEILALAVKDLVKMKLEFPQTFIQLFEDVETQLKEYLMLKLEIIKKFEMEKFKRQDTMRLSKNGVSEEDPEAP